MTQLPEAVDAGSLGALLDLTPRRLRQLAQQGVLTKRGHGKYPLRENVRAYLAWKVESEVENRGAAKETTSQREEIRLLREQRKLAEEDRRLIAIEEHDMVLDEVVGAVRERFAGLPARHTRDAARRRQLEDDVNAILSEVADLLERRSRELRTTGSVADVDEVQP